jgi:hypothetical protein
LLDPGVKAVDCAFARLAQQRLDFDPGALTNGDRLTGFAGGFIYDVEKIGAATQRTSGHVVTFHLNNLKVDYGAFDKYAIFDEQIEIESVTAKPFCSDGDSGALVFDSAFQATGLLFALSDSGMSYANPIAAVLHALAIEPLLQ